MIDKGEIGLDNEATSAFTFESLEEGTQFGPDDMVMRGD
jgi:hypothetical protein